MATFLLILFETLAFQFPSERQIESQTFLTVIANPMGSWFEKFAVISWIACTVSSFLSLFTRSKWGLLSFFAVLICPIVAIFSGVEDSITYYNHEDELKDIEGSEYHLFSNSFFQGNKLLIAKVNDRTGSRTNYAKLASGSFSGDANHVLLIRPQFKSSTSPLTITRGRILLCTYGEKYVFASYDLKRQVDLSIDKVSPFVLLGPKDAPNQTDFEEAFKGDPFNVSDPDVLKSELKNANPKVREMAKKLIAKLSLKAGSGP